MIAHKNVKKHEKSIGSLNSSPWTQEVKFWGVRGTIPTPGKHVLKYGGHTSCVQITSKQQKTEHSLILDAGSGIIELGETALKQGLKEFHILFTHMHYDHIIGLTKFTPLFRKDCEIHIYGVSKLGLNLKEILVKFFSAPFFPVIFNDLPSHKSFHFHELKYGESCTINNMRIKTLKLNHPQEAVAYRVWSPDGSKSIVYATDHEHGTQTDSDLISFINGTGLLIYDSTFSNETYLEYKGWGHSTAEFGAELAKQGKVSKYAIFHHEPGSSDTFLEENILKKAQMIFENTFLAKEQEVILVS